MEVMKKLWLPLVLVVVIAGGGFLWWRGVGGKTLGERDGKVEILAVGDVMLGRSVNTGMQRRKDYLWPFRETADVLRSADITFGNLENPLIADCPETDTGMIFCGELDSVKGLKFAGFDVMSVANNHIFNHGQDGLGQTVEVLKNAGIAPIGNGYSHEVVVEARYQAGYRPVPAQSAPGGVRVKWLGWEDVTKPLKLEEVEEVVKVEKSRNDVVVVSVHWGNEYKDKPSKRQRELGEALIDAGADIVIGHHPHWVQPVERYKDGVIAYSLGNFIFDQMWSEKTREGIAVKFLVPKGGAIEYELMPVKIYDYGQPRWVAQ